jgi:hypothetical protein
MRNPAGKVADVGVPAALASRMSVAEQHDWVRGFLQSRPVSRRNALRGAGGALAWIAASGGLSSALTACGSPARPAVLGRHLSFGADPTQQMAIAGELTAEPTGSVVLDIGTDPSYGMTVPAQIRELISHVPQQDGSIRSAQQFFVHAMTQRLTPGTEYHYRFRLPDGALSPDAVFRTAPTARVPFTFTAFGDQGVDGPTAYPSAIVSRYTPDDTRRAPQPASALVKVIESRRPAFHLLAGDICYADDGGKGAPVRNNAPQKPENGFANFDPTTWTAYFHSIEASAASTPWMFATGNHEMEPVYDNNTSHGPTHGYGGLAARLDFPGNGPGNCPSVYAFTYVNVGVISLDANDLSTQIQANTGYSGGAQARWARTTLAAMRANPAVEFIVAFYHHCAYVSGGDNGSDAGVRSTLAPLFDEFSVDLAVQGHNHLYERTDPIKAGRARTHAPDGATVHPATDGTTYICAGSGGRPHDRWRPTETDRYRGNPSPDSGESVATIVSLGPDQQEVQQVDWSQARYSDYAVLAVDVVPGTPGTSSTMTVRAITDLGQEIDTVTLTRPASPRHPKPIAMRAWGHTLRGPSAPGHTPP